MNTFSLLLKQMRQRALSTTLTLVSVMLGVALAITIMICQREGQAAFGQSDYGYNVLIGPNKGSGLTLVLNTVYHMEDSQGTIPFEEYEALAQARGALAGSFPKEWIEQGTPTEPALKSPMPLISWVVPYAVGDSYKSTYRIVATMPLLFDANLDGSPIVIPDTLSDDDKKLMASHLPEYRPGQRYTMALGRPFAYNKFEAIIGSDVAAACPELAVGGTFRATHGTQVSPNPDIHEEIWKVVGILNKTYTANDRAIFIPLMSFYAISEHEEGEEKHAFYHGKIIPSSLQPGQKAYTLNSDDTINLKLPEPEWEVSAILLRTNNTMQGMAIDIYKNRPSTMAVNPAKVMAEFFENILGNLFTLLKVITSVVIIVAAVSILVSIYNSVAARNREVAILRALGATRSRILTLVCLEAATIGLAGGLIGIIVGHLAAAVASAYLAQYVGHGIAWWTISSTEIIYLTGVVAIAFLAGLVPAFKAFRTPVAANLVN